VTHVLGDGALHFLVGGMSTVMGCRALF